MNLFSELVFFVFLSFFLFFFFFTFLLFLFLTSASAVSRLAAVARLDHSIPLANEDRSPVFIFLSLFYLPFPAPAI